MHFLKLSKNHVSYKIATFWSVFISLVDHFVHIRIETCMKIAFKQRFLPKIACSDISTQNYAKASYVIHNIAKLKSITMQMISDFMHFDTIAPQ